MTLAWISLYAPRMGRYTMITVMWKRVHQYGLRKTNTLNRQKDSSQSCWNELTLGKYTSCAVLGICYFPDVFLKSSNYIRDHCILSGLTNNLTRRKLTAIFVTFSKNKYRENKKLVKGNGFPRFLIFLRSSDFDAKKPSCFFCVCGGQSFEFLFSCENMMAQ